MNLFEQEVIYNEQRIEAREAQKVLMDLSISNLLEIIEKKEARIVVLEARVAQLERTTQNLTGINPAPSGHLF